LSKNLLKAHRAMLHANCNTATEFFEEIRLSDARLSVPRVDGSILMIFVENVILMARHPLSGGAPRAIANAHLVFEGVRSSKREIHEYLGTHPHSSILPAKTVEDRPFPLHSGKTAQYRLEGVLDEPHGWV
jgi:hypothetical protein